MKAKVCVLGMLALLWGSSARAAQWFVTPSVQGVGNGTSWSNAWSLGNLNANWNQVHAGDTVFLDSGTYTTSVNVGVSGASGNPIVIRAGQDPGHNGMVTFSAAAINLNSKSYVQVDGAYNNQNHILIQNVDVAVYGGSSNNLVKSVNTNEVGMAVSLAGTGNEVAYCNFTNTNGGSSTYGAVRFSGGGQSFDLNRAHHNLIEVQSAQGNGFGPDGIQTSSGTSVYNNTFTVKKINHTLPTPEHIDYLQAGGSNFLKVYNNEFRDNGDAAIQLGVWFNHAYTDVWIYNNLFRIVTQVDAYPNYIRMYANGGGVITSINNLKILNNTFVDGAFTDNSAGTLPVYLMDFGGNPTGAGNEVKNNIFRNTAVRPSNINIKIGTSTGWTNASWDFSNNIYADPNNPPSVSYNGVTYSMTDWRNFKEPNASTMVPDFVSYSAFSAANDFHLKTTDAAAKDQGVALPYFAYDRDGVARPQGSAWDVGAYELCQGANCGGGTSSSSSSSGAGSSSTGAVSSSMMSGSSLFYASSTAGASLSSSQSASAGSSSSSSGSSVFAVDVEVEAEAGEVVAPMQRVNNPQASGGQHVAVATENVGSVLFRFSVLQAGAYKLQARVLTPDPADAHNSFFITLDGVAVQGDVDAYDVHPSASFAWDDVRIRGNGSTTAPQFDPKEWTLSAGVHTFTFHGREADVRLDKVVLRPNAGASTSSSSGALASSSGSSSTLGASSSSSGSTSASLATTPSSSAANSSGSAPNSSQGASEMAPQDAGMDMGMQVAETCACSQVPNDMHWRTCLLLGVLALLGRGRRGRPR